MKVLALSAILAFAQDRGGTPPTVTPVIEHPCYEGIVRVPCQTPGAPRWAPTSTPTPPSTATPASTPTPSPSPVPPLVLKPKKSSPAATPTPVPDTPTPTTTPSPQPTALAVPTATPTPKVASTAGGRGMFWAGGLVLLAGAVLAWAVLRKREKPTDLHLE